MLEFEWNAIKAAENLRKHETSFTEAVTAFGDPDHSEGEHRFLLLGKSSSDKLLVISHTARDERIRLISARIATSRERKYYQAID